MNQIKTVLVGVDFSECSRCALEQAVRMARWKNASLSVIHVMDSSVQDNSLAGFQPELDELRRINREHVIGRLANWTKEAGAPEGHSREVMNGTPLAVLLEEGHSCHADLLVLGISPATRCCLTVRARCHEVPAQNRHQGLARQTDPPAAVSTHRGLRGFFGHCWAQPSSAC